MTNNNDLNNMNEMITESLQELMDKKFKNTGIVLVSFPLDNPQESYVLSNLSQHTAGHILKDLGESIIASFDTGMGKEN